MGVKNFKSLLISTPKCIELNSELILVLGFGLGSHPGPRPNIYFLWGESLVVTYINKGLNFFFENVKDFKLNCYIQNRKSKIMKYLSKDTVL